MLFSVLSWMKTLISVSVTNSFQCITSWNSSYSYLQSEISGNVGLFLNLAGEAEGSSSGQWRGWSGGEWGARRPWRTRARAHREVSNLWICPYLFVFINSVNPYVWDRPRSQMMSFNYIYRLFGGLFLDIKRKAPHYLSDYTDAISLQCLASFLFLYCACMSPVITFGGLLGEATEGRIVRTHKWIYIMYCISINYAVTDDIFFPSLS